MSLLSFVFYYINILERSIAFVYAFWNFLINNEFSTQLSYNEKVNISI